MVSKDDKEERKLGKVQEISAALALEIEQHFKLYPDARIWITDLAYRIYDITLGKVDDSN